MRLKKKNYFCLRRVPCAALEFVWICGKLVEVWLKSWAVPGVVVWNSMLAKGAKERLNYKYCFGFVDVEPSNWRVALEAL